MFKKIIIGVAISIVLGGAALFVIDRTLFAPVEVSAALPVAPTVVIAAPTASNANTQTNPAPLVVTATPESASAAGSGSAQQVYRIDAAQSEVRYEVGETLFNQNNRLQTAVGRTQGMAGEILVDFQNPANSQIGTLVIDVSQFTSDEDRRDNYIRRTGLESSKYPTATFVATSIEGLPPAVAVGDKLSFTVTGNLTVKETTRPVTWNVTLEVQDGKLLGSATTQILMSDFNAGPITLAMLQTEDQVKLTFDFVAVAAS